MDEWPKNLRPIALVAHDNCKAGTGAGEEAHAKPERAWPRLHGHDGGVSSVRRCGRAGRSRGTAAGMPEIRAIGR
ncbi:MAG: hypothetical protein V8Q84_01795 [Bilophila sp.]